MLIGGMAGTTDLYDFRAQLTNLRGILTGVVCQFVLLPFLGFSSVFAFGLPRIYGIMLLLTTTSPGGGFSGWWCSLGNADLALSVAMTTVSTLVSIVMLPVNVLIYVQFLYGTSVELDWWGIGVSIGIVIGAVIVGVSLGTWMPKRKSFFNKIGTLGGLANIALAALTSSGSSTPLWGLEPEWYLAVSAPCVAGLVISFVIARVLRCSGPEAVSICIECCYQNTGLAITVALTIFEPEEAALATGVPIFYGGIEIVLIAVFTLVAWQMGWTYAHPRENFIRCVVGNYQPIHAAQGMDEVDVDVEPPNGEAMMRDGIDEEDEEAYGDKYDGTDDDDDEYDDEYSGEEDDEEYSGEESESEGEEEGEEESEDVEQPRYDDGARRDHPRQPTQRDPARGTASDGAQDTRELTSVAPRGLAA